jgi:hypothetical protein
MDEAFAGCPDGTSEIQKAKITQGNKVRGVVKKRWIYGQF